VSAFTYDHELRTTVEPAPFTSCLEAVIGALDYSTSSEAKTQVLLPLEYVPGRRQLRLYLPRPAFGNSIDKAEIQSVIRHNRSAVASCYEKELQDNTELEGRIKVKFTIAPDGTVSHTKVHHSTLESSTVEQCVLDEIATWKFTAPPRSHDVVVNYPFNFSKIDE
jgi:TonB family protein